MLKYFIYPINISFFYIEFDFLILYSHYGVIKIKNDMLTTFFCKNNLLYSLFINKNIVFFIKNIFILINSGCMNKFTLVGIGYRQFYSNNIVIYKLWYNHLVYKILPLDLLTIKKSKKRKYFTLFSLNKNKLNKVLHIWLSYRIMNIYTKKGFFKKNKKYYYKPVIKKLV